jgi:predicted ribosomally synthesized peptide with SipW-like signal peptide
MQRIILGVVFIAGAVGVIATGSTGAFFSDAEASTGNTFTAGAIDLKVANDSYYDGNRCTEVTPSVFEWEGTSTYPVAGTPCSTSWELGDLTKGQLFFNFGDIKPGDNGEDTIGLQVDNNDAYACMNLSLTSNDDSSSTPPELAAGDTPDDPNNTWDGELAQNIQMFWWADDGDNVYEQGEQASTDGVETLYNMGTTTPFSVALADSTHNVWATSTPSAPLTGGKTYSIGKEWCLGTLTLNPVAQDGLGKTNPDTNGPQIRGTGLTCNGTLLGNLTQTDSATVDLAFTTVQARNNPNFSCGSSTTTPMAKITVTKIVQNTHGGNNIVSDFQLFVDNGTVTTPVTSGVTTIVTPGDYFISETGVSGYVGTYGGDCNASGEVLISSGDNKHCTITNSDLPGNITLNSVVTPSGSAVPSTFGFMIDGAAVPNNTSVSVTSNSSHVINETGRTGFHFVSITGDPLCPSVLGGTATLNEGQAITCTITNAKN